ncbi:heterokaryon incompatibility protein-domain-containing protein [Halenospora varia]|nr:heterokaryon incompatibility protein-domain-containing protein [Halenospora varia]
MATQTILEHGLCKVCQRISLEALLTVEGVEHISDSKLLYASAEQCRVCSLIHESISSVFPQRSSYRWHSPSNSPRFTILRGLERENFGLDHILVCCGFVGNTFEHRKDQAIIPPGTYLVGRLEISAEEEDPAAKFVKHRRIPRNPGSEDSMFMVTQLVDECINIHSRCRAPQTTFLPTRILDVGSIVDSTVLLLISGDLKARYAALSYCWGGRQEVVAKEDSLEAMTRGIAISVLPKTIQDAVTVTRRLGLRYLWVDALCIKQDSKEDWASESSKMADIYGNATITIAAAGGSNCSAGCFIEASSNPSHTLERIRLPLPDLSIGTISLWVQNIYHPLEDALNKRAWALQERLLSPRLLVYSSGSVSWQCQTKVKQIGIGSVRLPDFFFEETPVNSHEIWQWNRQVSNHSSQVLVEIWNQIALDYSYRAITYNHDRLPALSGLARRFRDVTGDIYLAGLWEKALCPGLMWQTLSALKSRPSTYIAPTWSWLSVPGPILYANYERTRNPHLVEILEAGTVLAGSDETGAILSGKITLRGQMKLAQRKGHNQLWGVVVEELVRIGHALVDFESDGVDAIDGPLWCLRIFKDKGLLLKPSGENYQRVGIFLLSLDVDVDGHARITGQTWFKDSELQTLTLCVESVSEMFYRKYFVSSIFLVSKFL